MKLYYNRASTAFQLREGLEPDDVVSEHFRQRYWFSMPFHTESLEIEVPYEDEDGNEGTDYERVYHIPVYFIPYIQWLNEEQKASFEEWIKDACPSMLPKQWKKVSNL